MSFISNIQDGQQIDEAEMKSAISELKKNDMLLSSPNLDALVKILDKGDAATNSYLLDNLKSVFARDKAYLTLTINGVTS